MYRVRFEVDAPKPVEVLRYSGTTVTNGFVGGYYVRTRTGVYDSLCTSPCAVNLEPGAYKFGMRMRGRDVISAGRVTLSEPSVLHAKYEDNQSTRTAGWLVFTGGIIGSTALMVAGALQRGQGDDPSDGVGLVLAGLGGTVLTTVFTWPLVTAKDKASLELMPE